MRQNDGFISARRALLQARRHWYPIMVDLNKFTVAVSRIAVSHDGYCGAIPDAMVWDNGSILKPRFSPIGVIIDQASLPGPPDFWDSSWCRVSCSPTTQEDVAIWRYSVTYFSSSLDVRPLFTGLRVLLIWAISFFFFKNSGFRASHPTPPTSTQTPRYHNTCQ